MEHKTSTSFRLTDQAKAAVNLLAEAAGLSATAYLEQLIRREAATLPPAAPREYPPPALSPARRRILALLAEGAVAARPDHTHGWQVTGQPIQVGTLTQMRGAGWVASADEGRTYTITAAGRTALAAEGEGQ